MSSYDLPYACPFLSPRFFLAALFCPCYLSGVLYGRIFKRKSFSLFGFIFLPFSVYGIRRYVVDELGYEEDYEKSVLKSLCFLNSLTQDLHEMKLKRIGVYKYLSEPPPDDSSDYDF
ncbi:hypothetical protein NBO_66g0030 [Nosema bombycis CQ1]|uniref:Transmembrane protein n=1 Tax=Nosema bombycis (strain CQ1 / CVCC 102059) TaxID=578461 RepID=R0KS29_NOSB1|nr:hypothetical protein NBO_66g0030 [Nosema bombycis CQ1]|eukprot:EOB13571.1 hypothetical protein NBO_66g0030 [Nosema bombycis CQ1]